MEYVTGRHGPGVLAWRVAPAMGTGIRGYAHPEVGRDLDRPLLPLDEDECFWKMTPFRLRGVAHLTRVRYLANAQGHGCHVLAADVGAHAVEVSIDALRLSEVETRHVEQVAA